MVLKIKPTSFLRKPVDSSVQAWKLSMQPKTIIPSVSLLLLGVLTSCNGAPRPSEKQEWLPKLFPSIEHCTPHNLYYDEIKHESLNQVIEKHGYKNPALTVVHHEGFGDEPLDAIYAINETFYGAPATQLSISRGEPGTWEIKVSTPAEKLAENIYKATNKKVKIYKDYNSEFVPPEIAHIIPDGKNSIFSCYIMVGDD